MAVKQLFKKFTNLNKRYQSVQEKYDKLADKSAIIEEQFYDIEQKLVKKYVNKTESATILLPEDVKQRYGVDHLTITEENGVYSLDAYNGEDISGEEKYIPTEVIIDILFNNVKQLYNEI